MILSAGEAQRLTQRIKLTASSVRDGMFKLRNLVDEAKQSNVWQVLGFQSWTAYLADTLADEPMRLGREERQELVGYLAGEGLSTRAIAPIVGVSQKTVDREVRQSRESNDSPEPEEMPAYDASTGEVIEDAEIVDEQPAVEAKPITGLDGKQYTRPEPQAPRRPSLMDDVNAVERALFKDLEKLRAIVADDRFAKNKASIRDALRPIAGPIREILTDLFTDQS